MKTRIHKQLEWIRPFLLSVQDIINLERLSWVKGYKVQLNKQDHGYATILRSNNNKVFNINIKTARNLKVNNKKTHCPEYLEIFLLTLAHELAHIHHWEHTPEHFELQVKVLRRFSKVLKQLNVKDTFQQITRMKNK